MTNVEPILLTNYEIEQLKRIFYNTLKTDKTQEVI